jgi:hypothetical protein
VHVRVTRLASGPIIGPHLHPSIGVNIQGPSLIRVPYDADTGHCVLTSCVPARRLTARRCAAICAGWCDAPALAAHADHHPRR